MRASSLFAFIPGELMSAILPGKSAIIMKMLNLNVKLSMQKFFEVNVFKMAEIVSFI